MKRIVVCCDGTWQRLTQPFSTNVAKTAAAVAPRGADGAIQIVFHDDGVGTDQTFAPRLAALFGGTFGRGLEENVCEAYRFVVLNYEPGDEIYLFGFSRGAYTARSLAGLIDAVGILRRAECVRALEAFRLYRAGKPLPAANPFWAYTHGRLTKPIAFLGVWDTVGARGIPESIAGSQILNRQFAFHSVGLCESVASARHAVALDERRQAFPPCLWDNVAERNAAAGAAIVKPNQQPFQQHWFVGDHGNVGGGVEVDDLSNIALCWILEGATRAGLAFDPTQLQYYENRRDPTAPFSSAIFPTRFSPAQLAYALIGRRDRPSPSGVEEMHPSALTRWRENERYRPGQLLQLLQGYAPPHLSSATRVPS